MRQLSTTRIKVIVGLLYLWAFMVFSLPAGAAPPSGEGDVLSNTYRGPGVLIYNLSDTLYIYAWSDLVDYTDLKRAEIKLEDVAKVLPKYTINLTNNGDGTYD